MVNYFELYNIPESFSVDKGAVKKKFYELSRTYHPDRFTLADDDKKEEALKMSAINNEAYKTLKSEDELVAYLLRLKEVLEADEKYNLPPDFLMEMMELNELVSELEMEPDNNNLLQQAKSAYNEQATVLNNELKQSCEQYSPEADNSDLLKAIKDLYFRKKYLLRIQERMNTFATR